MAKNLVNVNQVTNQQRISKILMSQCTSAFKQSADYCKTEEEMKTTIPYKIATSRAHTNGCIGGWDRGNDFSFTFEYGRKRNSVRVSYLNSDGMISAVFTETQWICMTDFIKSKLDDIIINRKIEMKRQEELEFRNKVEEAVDRILFDKEMEKARMARMQRKVINE